MRDRHARRPHQLEVARAGVVEQRVVGDEVAVADVERRPQHADAVEQLDRRHAVLAHDVVEFEHVVRGVRRHRQLQGIRRLARAAQQVDAHRLEFARHENAAHKSRARLLHAPGKGDRVIQPAQPGGFVHGELHPPALLAHPVPAAETRPEVAAHAESRTLPCQRLLDAQLTAVLDEGRDAVPQHLRDGVHGVMLQLLVHARLACAHVAHVAFDAAAFSRHADLEEGLAEIVRAPGVGDQAVRCAVPGMHMRVDEARTHELARGIDGRVDSALELRTHIEDLVALEDDLVIPVEAMVAVAVPDHPAAPPASPHGLGEDLAE